MDYKCKTVTIDKLIASPNGFVMPICQTCKAADCTNPIEKKIISIVGIKKEIKVFSKGNSAGFVVTCNGYVK